jgi:hypothetical protein
VDVVHIFRVGLKKSRVGARAKLLSDGAAGDGRTTSHRQFTIEGVDRPAQQPGRHSTRSGRWPRTSADSGGGRSGGSPAPIAAPVEATAGGPGFSVPSPRGGAPTDPRRREGRRRCRTCQLVRWRSPRSVGSRSQSPEQGHRGVRPAR